MSACFYCENGDKLKSLMIEVCQLKYSIVYLNRDQKHKGRVIVAFKGHKEEYFQFTPEENQGYFAELALVAKAIFVAFEPQKINYATFGDLVPHAHMHVVPKYKDGLQWGRPFNDGVDKVFLDDAEYDSIIGILNNEIKKLLG
ncbi:MAG: histidine triad (HIT) protein [Epulopiscium sp. Nuni2H_MBin001]|nr:MAG: histidine triad (HIT) protein [Epulopiscium sp. Nuni2H_MBin001]